MPTVFRRIKNRLIFAAAKAAVFLVGRLPKSWTPAIGRGIGGAAFAAAGYERRCAGRQLKEAFGARMTEERARMLTRGVFNRLAWSAVELSRMIRNPKERPEARLSESGGRVLDEALQGGRGVIFVTGHVGNWELMAATLAALGYPIHTVAKRSYDPRFTTMIERARATFGVRAIYRGDAGAAAAMIRVLRGNGVLGFLIDQDTDVPSVYAPFFGLAAKTPSGPAVLAHRRGVPVVLGTISRTGGGGSHRIDIIPVPLDDDAEKTTAALNRLLEARIRRHPAEWVWFHRRWKSREPQEVA